MTGINYHLTDCLPFFGDKLLKDITPPKCKHTGKSACQTPPDEPRRPKPNRPQSTGSLLASRPSSIRPLLTVRRSGTRRQGVKLLKENNERDRILSPDEYVRLLAACPPHLKPIVKVAYYTAMRQGEILSLTWGQVDLKRGDSSTCGPKIPRPTRPGLFP